jgi:hypothetical protein
MLAARHLEKDFTYKKRIERNDPFDFGIAAGNAIKLLELSNYPKEIINEARQISSAMTNKAREFSVS